MFTLFDGEKYYNKHKVTERFSDNIILDVKSDFELKKLENYTIFEAIKAFRCAQKNATENNVVRLIYPKRFNALRKGCFYLQQISIHNFVDIAQKFSACNLFILEEVVAVICSSRVAENQGWIYATKHSKWRIICGYQKGIIVSRSLSEHIDINAEIERTLIYLRRFNLVESFQVFLLNHPSEMWNDFFQNSNTSSSAVCLLAEKLSLNPIKKKRNALKKQLDIASTALFSCAFVLGIFGVGLHMWNVENAASSYDFHLKNKNVEVRITPNNINEIEKFFGYFQHEFLPWNDFALVRKMFPNIVINKISTDKNIIKVYTNSPISKNNDKNISVNQQNNEYVICIKK